MPQFEELYVGNHRRQQSLVLVMSMLCLLLAIAPRQERALFITQGNGLTAFGAAFPPINVASLLHFPGGLTGADTPAAFFAGVPGRPAGAAPLGDSPAAGPGGGGGGSDSPIGDAPGTPLSEGVTFQPASAPGGGGGLPFLPASFSPPTSSPVAATAADTPTPVPTTPVVTPTTTPTPTPAVPEPATWLLLMAGFVGIGLVARSRAAQAARLRDKRRPDRARQSQLR